MKIVADKVNEYLHLQFATGTSFACNEFYCVRAPFKRFWIEWSGRPDGDVLRTGVLCSTEELSAQSPERLRLPNGEHYRHLIGFTPAWEFKKNVYDFNLRLADYAICLCCNDDGEIQANRETGAIYWTTYTHTPDRLYAKKQKVDDETLQLLAAETIVPMKTIDLFHTKGISTSIINPNKQGRKARNGNPLLSYRVIEMQPLIDALKSLPQGEPTGIKQGSHVMPAHFKYYGRGKYGEKKGLLFGKYAGKVWEPEHLRGSEKYGKAYKDYSVSP